MTDSWDWTSTNWADENSWEAAPSLQDTVPSSSSGWRSPGQSGAADSVDLGYIDQEIVILGKKVMVRVAYTAKGVEDWIEQCSTAELQFGIDIEWRPNQIRGEDNSAAIFQIAGDHGCLIVQLLYIDYIPTALKELLANSEVKLGGVGVKWDIQKLLHDYGLKCCGGVDLGSLAANVLKRKELKRAGLARLCDLVLGVPFKKSKSLTMSDWAVEGLSLPQITYAASDACVAYSLLVALNDKLAERLEMTSSGWHPSS